MIVEPDWMRLRREADALTDPGPTVDHSDTADRPVEAGVVAAGLRAQIIAGADITTLPPPSPLIEGVIDLDSTAALYGKAGSYKTFVALDMACCVASGEAWHGHTVTQGRVLYIAGEGVGGIGVRVAAWMARHPQADISGVDWLPRAVNLLDPASVAGLTQIVVDGYSLVVVDTVARAMIGGEENSTRDMGRFVEALDVLRRAANGCVLAVHHTGKNEAAGMRGSSAFEAGIDTAWEAARPARQEGVEQPAHASPYVSLKCARQKNHPTEAPPINLAVSKEGPTIVLVDDERRPGDQLAPTLRTTLQALADVDTGSGISSSVWLEVSGAIKPTFYRHRKQLLDEQYVLEVGSGRLSLTEKGRDALV